MWKSDFPLHQDNIKYKPTYLMYWSNNQKYTNFWSNGQTWYTRLVNNQPGIFYVLFDHLIKNSWISGYMASTVDT